MPFSCIHCKAEIDLKFKACPFCGEPMTDFLRRHLETPVDGKYKILSRLGVGGMGEVYKVLHVHLNAIRVIKLMRPNIAGDPQSNERFLREARLATKIQHPNVAALFDFSTFDDGSHYMVWEYIEGTNLHELIEQRGPLSPRYAAQVASHALMGLDAIHRAGIVHRDISPENLMIARDVHAGELVKIIDLGIAKSSAAEDTSTKTGMFVGKWKYCSPEHLGMLPKGERIDGRADIYSFGIVLYEMLTGVPPFQAQTPHRYLMMHAQEAPRLLHEANPRIAAAPELEALIFRALEKDRGKRFQTAREFAQALDAIAPQLSDESGAPPPLPLTAELTDEATRATPGALANAAQTVLTQELRREPEIAIATPQARRSGRAPMIAIAIAVALGAWQVSQRETAPMVTVTGEPIRAATVPVVAQRPGRLAINAFPWANVTSIRNLDNGEEIDIGRGLVTPAPVDLPPGRYSVTLSHPEFDTPIARTINIAGGADVTLSVQFANPATAALPDFDGGAH